MDILIVTFLLALSPLTSAGESIPGPHVIPAGLEAVTVLAADAASGKAVVRVAGGGLVVIGRGDEIPAGETRQKETAVLFRVLDVRADRLVVEEVARDGGDEERAGGRSGRLIRIYKPERPGLVSRIEVLERRLPRPLVPDLDPATEMPAGRGLRTALSGPGGGPGASEKPGAGGRKP